MSSHTSGFSSGRGFRLAGSTTSGTDGQRLWGDSEGGIFQSAQLLFQRIGTCPLRGRVLLVRRGLSSCLFPGLAELTLVLTPLLLSSGQLALQGLDVLARTIDFLVRTIFDGLRMSCKRLPLGGRFIDLAGQPFREFGSVALQSLNAQARRIAFLRQILDLGSLMPYQLLRFVLSGFRQ